MQIGIDYSSYYEWSKLLEIGEVPTTIFQGQVCIVMSVDGDHGNDRYEADIEPMVPLYPPYIEKRNHHLGRLC